MRRKAIIFCCILLMLIGKRGHAQASLCPTNIDFSLGNFDNWECRTGSVSGAAGINMVTWLRTGVVPDRHQLIAPTNTLLDPYGSFPQHCPNSGSYTVKLGNNQAGHQAEGMFYTFTIPANNTKFSLLYYYAIVMQDPGHSRHEQPRFRAKLIDVSDQTEINCVSFDFAASGQLPGFRPSPVPEVIYKDWTPISVDLSDYAGKTIRLEFITSDCVFNEHFGYAYINISPMCGNIVFGNNYCQGDSTTKITAPHGFRQYAWYSDTTFSQRIGQAQELSLNIVTTPVGSVLPVIVTPYPGYGCVDTLYAAIGSAPKPNANAGTDTLTCSKMLTQLGTAPTDNYSYTWTPRDKLSNSFVSNPVANSGLTVPTEFIVLTTDLQSGCFAYDTVLITPIIVDTASSAAGKMNYCPDEMLNTLLSVNDRSATVQWFKGDIPVAGGTGANYQPVSVGTYWAAITQSGCIDSSREYTVHQAPLPKPAFSMSKEIQCVNEPIIFSNKTTIPGNEPIRYVWNFSDGSSVREVNAEKRFHTNGIHTVTLVATSGTDCVDSAQQQIMIINDCLPVMPSGFTPNKDGKNDNLRPFLVGAKALKRFSVFNRWGNTVFSTTREGEAWDGTYKGAPLPTDVFIWTVEYITKDNRTAVQKGTVTLIR